MKIPRLRAAFIGGAAIGAVLLIQAFNSIACYQHDFGTYLLTVGIFILIPLIPAELALFSPNPLRAVGACLLFAPWLIIAYVTDCVMPYQGGGASMIYVAVFLWGTLSAIVGALITGPITRRLGIEIT